MKKMSLTAKIKKNPYLKIGNCVDIADIEAAMSDLLELEAEYGNSQTLMNLWRKFLDKKKKLQMKGGG